MPTSDYALADRARVDDDGCLVFSLGLPWYRSLPWASVADVRLDVDGRPAQVLTVDGSPVAELVRRPDYWFVQDRAAVRVRAGEAVQGEAIPVRLEVDLRLPGPLLPDGSPMPFAFAMDGRVTVR